jgi:site-specific DNA recombinase
MTRAAVYVRKSTSAGLEQEFNSLDAQRESCVLYARSQGWSALEETYEDGGYTGANVDRPAFQKLLADVDAGKLDVVVVYKVDRLSRSLLDFAKVMDRFRAAGVAFVSVTQNFSTADAMGRLTLNMLMSFAEFEREMIAERTRDKIAAARRRGKWTGGAVPFGYRVESSKLLIVESEARIVREIFALYPERRSLLFVIKELRVRERSRRGQGWTKDSLLRILHNPLYAGMMRLGKEVHPGEHEPIVTCDVFDRVAALMRRSPAVPPARNAAYVLRGILRCGSCGAAMTTASTRKGSRTYRFYRCVTRDKLGQDACVTRPIAAGVIESAVIDRLRTRAQTVNPQEIAVAIDKRLEDDLAHLRAMRADVPARIAARAREMDGLLRSIPTLSLAAARRKAEGRLEALDSERKADETQLEQWERKAIELQRAKVDAKWVASVLADFGDLWDKMTEQNQARLVAALVKRVTIHEGAGAIDIVLYDETDDEVAA